MLVIFNDVHFTDGTSETTINPRDFDKFGKILSDIIALRCGRRLWGRRAFLP